MNHEKLLGMVAILALAALAVVAFPIPEQALAGSNILIVDQSPNQSSGHDCTYAPMLLPF
jgi:hypothetical protein